LNDDDAFWLHENHAEISDGTERNSESSTEGSVVVSDEGEDIGFEDDEEAESSGSTEA
jgi:hypothetical protein